MSKSAWGGWIIQKIRVIKDFIAAKVLSQYAHNNNFLEDNKKLPLLQPKYA
jgi:hypothetical protein